MKVYFGLKFGPTQCISLSHRRQGLCTGPRCAHIMQRPYQCQCTKWPLLSTPTPTAPLGFTLDLVSLFSGSHLYHHQSTLLLTQIGLKRQSLIKSATSSPDSLQCTAYQALGDLPASCHSSASSLRLLSHHHAPATNYCPLHLAAAQHLLALQMFLLLYMSRTPICFPLLYVRLVNCPAWVFLYMEGGTPFSVPSLHRVYTTIPAPINHKVQLCLLFISPTRLSDS